MSGGTLAWSLPTSSQAMQVLQLHSLGFPELKLPRETQQPPSAAVTFPLRQGGAWGQGAEENPATAYPNI